MQLIATPIGAAAVVVDVSAAAATYGIVGENAGLTLADLAAHGRLRRDSVARLRRAAAGAVAALLVGARSSAS